MASTGAPGLAALGVTPQCSAVLARMLSQNSSREADAGGS
jgi:hypothetical protein